MLKMLQKFVLWFICFGLSFFIEFLGFAEQEGYNMSTATPDSISHMDPFYTMCTTIEAVYN